MTGFRMVFEKFLVKKTDTWKAKCPIFNMFKVIVAGFRGKFA